MVKTLDIFFAILIIKSGFEIQSRAESKNLFQKEERLPGLPNKLAEQQLQILKLYNNLNCIRKEDKYLEDISKSFKPLENLNLYKNPEVVKDYFENLNNGLYLGRTGVFVSGGETLRQSIQLFDVLYNINDDDWDLLYKTAVAAVPKINSASFAWTMGTLLTTKFGNGFKLPPTHEVIPQFSTPKWILLQANGEEGETNDDDHPESVLRYFTNDPTLSSFHVHWHTIFPYWWKPEKYNLTKEKKGELLMYTHTQLVNRYNAERLSNKLSEMSSFSLDVPIPDGDYPITLNIDLSEYPRREPNSTLKDVPGLTIADLKTWESRIREAIENGFLIHSSGKHISLRDDNGVEFLAATVEASEESVNPKYYRSLHNLIHRTGSKITDPLNELKLPPGILAHAGTSLQDPAFYTIHKFIVDLNRNLKEKFTAYSQKDLQFPDVYVSSVKIAPETDRTARKSRKYRSVRHFPSAPILKTFFEDYTYDISNGIKSCKKVNSGANFTATVRRLNHYSFEYCIRIYSRRPGNTRGIIRIYMSPLIDHNGKDFTSEEFYWNMIEMDRFPVTLTEGQNVVQRSSQNSAVTIPDRLGFQELIKEAKERMIKSGFTGKNARERTPCGFPDNLLVPKGTREGMEFKMFVIITDTSTGDYDEESYPSLPFCGNGRGSFPDGRPMGFPFDRKIGFDLQNSKLSPQNYMFTDLTVQHVN